MGEFYGRQRLCVASLVTRGFFVFVELGKSIFHCVTQSFSPGTCSVHVHVHVHARTCTLHDAVVTYELLDELVGEFLNGEAPARKRETWCVPNC